MAAIGGATPLVTPSRAALQLRQRYRVMPLNRIAAILYSVDVSNYHGYAAVQGRGTVALPVELRRKYRLDEPGAQLEVTEREDGVIELRPALPVPVDEMWFWSEGHQAAEREAEDDLAAGRFRTFDDADSFLADLESLATDPDR
jgi:bifunctional DNA-binding transcriptional regulator/antitoxin component of YhaV-PrlF toxin-antitoxin module